MTMHKEIERLPCWSTSPADIFIFFKLAKVAFLQITHPTEYY